MRTPRLRAGQLALSSLPSGWLCGCQELLCPRPQPSLLELGDEVPDPWAVSPLVHANMGVGPLLCGGALGTWQAAPLASRPLTAGTTTHTPMRHPHGARAPGQARTPSLYRGKLRLRGPEAWPESLCAREQPVLQDSANSDLWAGPGLGEGIQGTHPTWDGAGPWPARLRKPGPVGCSLAAQPAAGVDDHVSRKPPPPWLLLLPPGPAPRTSKTNEDSLLGMA